MAVIADICNMNTDTGNLKGLNLTYSKQYRKGISPDNLIYFRIKHILVFVI